MPDMPANDSSAQAISLPLLRRGKVRSLYEIGDKYLLMVASDRISAFDVILPTPIPGKGKILTSLSAFWLDRLCRNIPNQLTELALEDVLPADEITNDLRARSMIVKRTQVLPFEIIVRGYLAGSGWQDYQNAGAVCGIDLPPGLRPAERLPEAVITPSTKAEVGEHDVNVDFAAVVDAVGGDTAKTIYDVALSLYTQAARYAEERGIIIADTKFEFGIDRSGDVIIIDEVLTPDSSRFWQQSSYAVGISPPSFDKQFIRDYLNGLDWDKSPPGPQLPPEVVKQTQEKYQQASQMLTGAVP